MTMPKGDVPKYQLQLVDEEGDHLELGLDTMLLGATDPFPYLTLELKVDGEVVLRMKGATLSILHPGSVDEFVEAANRYEDLGR